MKKALKIKGSLLLTCILAATNLQSNAQTSPGTTPTLGEQATAAGADSKGPFFFISPDKDMAAKGNVGGDSWYVISHVTSGARSFDVLTHYLTAKLSDGPPAFEGTVTVFDPVSKKYIVGDKTYTQAECSLSQTELNVQTPTGLNQRKYKIGTCNGQNAAGNG